MVIRYLNLLKKDWKIAIRNNFLWIVLVVAFILAGIIHFVVPEEVTFKPTVYFAVNTQAELTDSLQEIFGTPDTPQDKIQVVRSRDEIIKRMKEQSNSIGLYISQNQKKPVVEFIVQGYENEKIRNLLLLTMRDEINRNLWQDVPIRTVELKPEGKQEDLPVNKNILPLILLMEPVLMGFILIAALIFMEKEEGTIKAYMVSPGRIYEYLASKIMVMLILGLISALIVSILVAGLKPDYFFLLILIALGSIAASSTGLIMASFFYNISQSTIWMVIITIVISLPAISYFMPGFAPLYIKILPTYPLLFAIREAVFPSGNTGLIYSTMLIFFALSLTSYYLAVLAYKRNLSKV